jgi:hypothetical protein
MGPAEIVRKAAPMHGPFAVKFRLHIFDIATALLNWKMSAPELSVGPAPSNINRRHAP